MVDGVSSGKRNSWHLSFGLGSLVCDAIELVWLQRDLKPCDGAVLGRPRTVSGQMFRTSTTNSNTTKDSHTDWKRSRSILESIIHHEMSDTPSILHEARYVSIYY